MCHCTEYKLWALQVRLSEKNNINATTQQFLTAKISGCVLKQGGETHSSLRQSKLQLQNQAALRSRQIRAVEHWRCAAGLAGVHPGLRDRILLNYTRTENAHKVRKKTFVFCDVLKSTGPYPGGMEPPLEKFSSPREKCVGRIFKLLDIVLKNCPAPKKLFAPPWCPKVVTCLEVQQTFSFPSSMLRHYQMPECFCFNNFLSSCNSFFMLQKLVM